MSYLTVEVKFEHGKVVPNEPEKLPESGAGLLTILSAPTAQNEPPTRTRIQLPLIRGDGKRIINPSPEELDASLWD